MAALATDVRSVTGYDPRFLLSRPRHPEMMLAPVPLRAGCSAQIRYPRDLTRVEAAKLARVILALGAL